jgi:cytoskeleton protein RodZ
LATFGERLRREREMRGVSLNEIATATKIGTRSLKALEDEDFSKLPGGIFNKGFVRAYARFLGIDEDQAVADYVAAAGAQEQSSEAVIEKLAAESERRADEKRIQRQRESAEPPFTWNTVALVVVIAVAAVLGWQYYAKHKGIKLQQASTNAIAPAGLQRGNTTQGQNNPASNAPDGSAASAPAPVLRDGALSPAGPVINNQTAANQQQATAENPRNNNQATQAKAIQNRPTQTQGASPNASQQSISGATETANATSPAQEFVVVVRAKKQSWLSSLADGASHTARLLPANAEATFHARSTLRLTVGNAGGVEISFNGKTLPLIGEENKSKTLIFTPGGLQQ